MPLASYFSTDLIWGIILLNNVEIEISVGVFIVVLAACFCSSSSDFLIIIIMLSTSFSSFMTSDAYSVSYTIELNVILVTA